MKETPSVIFADSAGWKIGRDNSLLEVPMPPGATSDQHAQAIVASLGSVGANVILALPASSCFSATVSLAGLPARNRRTTLLYRVELLLPLTAEEIVADYIFDEPASALAICAPLAAVRPIVDALENAGVVVDSIVPASIYAGYDLLNRGTAKECDAIVWQSKAEIEIFLLRHEQIVGWYILPAEMEDFRWHLTECFGSRSSPATIFACNLAPDFISFLQSSESFTVAGIEQLSIEAAVLSGLAAGLKLPVDLRRDGLVPSDSLRAMRRPLTETILSTVLLIACICGAACWRAVRLERLTTKYRDQQASLFQDIFPGHIVPVNIVSRLQSEERALSESNGASSEASLSQMLMPTLQSVLSGIASLPPDVKFQVQDFHLEESHFALEGVVRNRSDLDQLANAIGQQPQLQIDAPQTEQIPGKGLQINLTGAWNPEPKLK